MKKQIKIAKWLKGLCVFLALLGILFFGGLTWYIFKSGNWFAEDASHFLAYCSWYTCIVCYVILFQFWKVCCEIEKDNSFSLENARYFHNMMVCGGAFAAGYVVRIIYDLIIGFESPAPIIYAVVLTGLSFAFTVVCEALSQLIKNAYEVQLENELTI